jgi:hypothetical protein
MAGNTLSIRPKNAWLMRERGVCFEQIIALIEIGKLIQVLEHHDQAKYPKQLLYEVDVDGYVYIVPVARNDRTLFLRLFIPAAKPRGSAKDVPDEKSGIL